jgi:hypothetical protein
MAGPRAVGEIMRREFVSLQVGDRLDFVQDLMGIRIATSVSTGGWSRSSRSAICSQTRSQGERLFMGLLLRSVGVAEAMSRNVISVGPEMSIDRPRSLIRGWCLPS